MAAEYLVGKKLVLALLGVYIEQQKMPSVVTFIGPTGIGKNYLVEWLIQHYVSKQAPTLPSWVKTEPYEHYYQLDNQIGIQDQIEMLQMCSCESTLFLSVSEYYEPVPQIPRNIHLFILNRSGPGLLLQSATETEVTHMLISQDVHPEKAAKVAYMSSGIPGNAIKLQEGLDPMTTSKKLLRKILTGTLEEVHTMGMSFYKNAQQVFFEFYGYWLKFVKSKQLEEFLAVKLHRLITDTATMLGKAKYDSGDIVLRFLLSAQKVAHSDALSCQRLYTRWDYFTP